MTVTPSPLPPASKSVGKWRRTPPMAMAGEAGAGPEAVTPDMVGMVVPQQLLHEDEVVLLLTKPSLFFIFYSSFFFVLLTLMVGAGLSEISRSTVSVLPSPSVIATITAVLCAGRLIWALLVWTSHVYMLTNLRIVTIKGVVNTHMFQTTLRKVQKTDLYRPIAQRLVGTGTIGFSTAAAANSFDSTWVMISRPLQTHEQIVAAINKANPR